MIPGPKKSKRGKLRLALVISFCHIIFSSMFEGVIVWRYMQEPPKTVTEKYYTYDVVNETKPIWVIYSLLFIFETIKKS